MATHTLTKNNTKTWEINKNNDTWILAQNARLTVVNAPAVYLAGEYHDNKISILGDILNTGRDSYGLLVDGSHNEITIGVDAQIEALTGIIASGTDTDVTNKGNINTSLTGVALFSSSTLTNSGKLDGAVGAVFGVDGTLVNLKGGQILGGQSGAAFVTGATIVKNYGLISGGDLAIDDGDGAAQITNRGRIDGDVSLLGGADIFDNRNGTLYGTVYGGEGNDTYILTKSVKIVENFHEGFDTVKSSVAHTLGANMEKLRLTGSADVNGTGNSKSNVLHGNNGDNTMLGLGGNDHIKGGAGTDILTGGEGKDLFIFRKGFETDTITDFTDMADKIQVLGYSGIQKYGQLQSHISQHDSDIWITLAAGDKIVIEDRSVSILSTDDFTFGM